MLSIRQEGRRDWRYWVGVILLAIIFSPLRAYPDDAKPSGKASTFVFYLENDFFSGTDRHYTNAVKFSYISKDLRKENNGDGLPSWARRVLEKTRISDREIFHHNIAVSLGQNIYTPREISEEALIEDDRPYAGWTYLSTALQSQSQNVLNSLELSLGIVGPSALAEESQEIFHGWFETTEPEGWDNQLKDEPGLMLTFQRFQRSLHQSVGDRFAWDVIPHAGLTLGNVFTYANLGSEVRFGYNLPADFGTSLIRPGGGTSIPVSMADPRLKSRMDFSWSLFAGFDGRAVARNIFLDGNTFRDSHSVDKKYFVADVYAGISLVYKKIRLTYTQVYRTEEFHGQDSGQGFGSVTMAVMF